MNRVEALKQVIAANATIQTMTDGRIYANELPQNASAKMPRNCIVVKSAPGMPRIRSMTTYYSDRRVDVEHYGWTVPGAMELAETLYAVLENLQTTRVGMGADATLVYWARNESGPFERREPPVPWPGGAPADRSAHWPCVITTWQVLAADQPAA